MSKVETVGRISSILIAWTIFIGLWNPGAMQIEQWAQDFPADIGAGMIACVIVFCWIYSMDCLYHTLGH